jgi:hypothetical protein
MNTVQIKNILNRDEYSKKVFRLVVPRDKLPSKVTYPAAYVINTQGSQQRGEHWLAVFYEQSGYCSFFDSYGMSPSFYNLREFVFKTSHGFEHNMQQLQGLSSNVCGNYCVYFIMLKARGFSMKEILHLFDKENFLMNDFKMKCFLD